MIGYIKIALFNIIVITLKKHKTTVYKTDFETQLVCTDAAAE